MPFYYLLLVYRLLPTVMDLSFYFAAPTRRFAVFGLTPNMLVKIHSDLLALGFLTDVVVIGTLGLLCVSSSRVYTIKVSRISLIFC